MADILVLDDDPDVCLVLRYALEADGHNVETALDTRTLPALLASRPDIVLLDVLMPDAHGLESLPRIQSLAPGTRIVIITGVNDYRVADLFYESGVDGFLTKPIHIATLTDTVRRLLDQPTLPSAP